MTAVSSSVELLNSELRAADPALLNNSAILAAVLAGSGDCIKILDLDGRLQFMSEGGKKVMEVDDFSVLKGCPWPDFWLGEGNAAARQAIEDARNGKVARFLGPANTAMGTPKFWDVRVMPIIGAEGRPTHILSISTDITEAREAELAARESQIQTKLALAAAEMGVWQARVVDGQFSELQGDDRALTLLGGTPGQEASFEDFVSRLAPGDRDRLAPAAAKALDPNGDGILDLEYRVLGKHGEPDRWVHARAQALSSSMGKRLIGTVRDITARKESDARQAVLSGELQHRVKNTLAMVNAIATQTLKGEDIESRRAAFSARIDALAQAHDILTATTWVSAPIRSVIEGALTPHMNGEDRFVLEGGRVNLTAGQALSMALTVHELATNAAKYGAMSTPAGKVHIKWETASGDDGEEFRFVWRELDGPKVIEPERKGFGTRVITRVLAADFSGKVSIHYDPGGIVCSLVSPASSVSTGPVVPNEMTRATN